MESKSNKKVRKKRQLRHQYKRPSLPSEICFTFSCQMPSDFPVKIYFKNGFSKHLLISIFLGCAHVKHCKLRILLAINLLPFFTFNSTRYIHSFNWIIRWTIMWSRLMVSLPSSSHFFISTSINSLINQTILWWLAAVYPP